MHAGGWRASGLALLEVSPIRLLLAQLGLLETWIWANIQRITRVLHCANVVWPDLAKSLSQRPNIITPDVTVSASLMRCGNVLCRFSRCASRTPWGAIGPLPHVSDTFYPSQIVHLPPPTVRRPLAAWDYVLHVAREPTSDRFPRNSKLCS